MVDPAAPMRMMRERRRRQGVRELHLFALRRRIQWLITTGIVACASTCIVTPPRKLWRRRLCV
jgi:hypothetical protein